MLFGVVLAFCLTATTAYLQIKMMQPLQRYYLVPFLKSSLLPMKQDLKLVEVHTTAGEDVAGRSAVGGYVMAIDPWINVIQHQNQTLFVLTDEGLRLGLSRPRAFAAQSVAPAAIRGIFEKSIYAGTVPAAFRLTLCVFALALAAGMIGGAIFDQRHQEKARQGVLIRGPRLMQPREAQKYLKGDGIALFLEPNAK
jgi:hypothetical protein